MDDSRERHRSRSPRRAPKGSGGFRWKDKRPKDHDDRRTERRDDHRDERRPHERRDYRDRSPRHRDNDRERREPERGRERDYDRRRDGNDRREGRPPRAEREKSDKKDKNDPEDKDKPARKEKKPSASKPAAAPEMIIVNVNDRLGTKAAIPCLASDTVGQLKLMVAARIGREAGQIMLKRQSERPFKDHICLADYGISNGVQLDLEVDTGD